ncbi:MAG: class I SAM-dependent methyltransferase [Clostridiaceae bacterium]|nr:class I SAM-dependent methyltransferase [Clostridiaceae bacterium]
MQATGSNSNNMPPVSETLLIPLVARAKEMARNNPIISDKKSMEIISKIDTTGKVIDGGEISTHGILARTKIIDDEVKNILSKNPDTTIINLGAGLDTRICRVYNGILKWYDLDLPEVISIRRQFFTENERIRFISKSVLDAAWVNEINTSESSNIVIIAEGLLMYFTEENVAFVLDILSKHFAGAHMFFDVVHTFFINKKISSTFLWGIEQAKDIEKLNARVKLIRSWSTGDLLKERQPLFLRIFNILPSTRNRSQILHIEFARQDK